MRSSKGGRLATLGFCVSEKLASVPSLYNAATYLVMIPAFALAYYEIPNGFFEPNISQEVAFPADYRNITHRLAEEINKQLQIWLVLSFSFHKVQHSFQVKET